MFNTYYQDELHFLREMGREFAAAHPQSARYLAEAGSDPDVERMLEGFAFLSARLRQKLDDELPELTHALIDTFWPHYLRPVPSTTIIQFEAAQAGDKEWRTIPRGTLVDSLPVDGTRCRFRTAYEVRLPPAKVEAVSLQQGAPATLRVRLRLPEGVTPGRLGADRLRFHLAGDAAVSRALHLSLVRRCARVTATTVATGAASSGGTTTIGVGRVGGAGIVLPADSVRAVGFAPEHALVAFPGASFPGFRLLQEYFCCPHKFMFVDVVNLAGLAGLPASPLIELAFTIDQPPDDLPAIGVEHLLLGCTPAVNLFTHEADPITCTSERGEHLLRPMGRDPAHYEIHSVDRVSGASRGSAMARTYQPLFNAGRDGEGGCFYQVRRHPAVVGQGWTHHLAVVAVPGREAPTAIPDGEVLSLSLTCSNRRLCESLGVGDIAVPTAHSPAFARFRNITRPTPAQPPPDDEQLPWRLLEHLALNYRTLLDVAALRTLFDLYDFRAGADQQALQAHRRLCDGLVAIAVTPTLMMDHGLPLRGLGIDLTVKEDHFDSEGELHLFSLVLDEFLSQYVSMNTGLRLTVRGANRQGVTRLKARLGRRQLL